MQITSPMRRLTGRLVCALIILFALTVPGLTQGVQITTRDGRVIDYTPSFAPKPKEQRPQYRFFDTSTRKWVTYQASREEMRERHRMRYARAVVPFHAKERPGTVIVDTKARYLYLVNGDGTAIRYGVGVGREGFTWSGVERVTRKAEWPDWRPPAEMLDREPWLPEFMPGGPNNPMGARALYLGSTLYRIHGTHQDHTIGYAVSSGCIRMLNEDIEDLYERVPVGAEVVVLGPGADRATLLSALSVF